jgi:hypothetical protein
MKGMMAYIYRDSMSDSSNNGISSRYDKVVVVDSELPEIFEPTEDMPAVKLVRRVIGGDRYIHAEPLSWRESDDIKGMFGGCYIMTSDSRFRKVCQYPIPLHDRGESQEMYDRLSR